MSSLIWFRSLGDVIVLEFCAPGLLFRTRLLSQLDTVVTGEAVFCQIPMRQTNVLEYLKLFFRFAERMSRRPGAVVGNYKMYEEDPDEVKSLSYLNIFEQYMPYLNNISKECIGVESVFLHEDYDSFNINNDICVLILESEATLGPNVGAIPLPESGEEYEEGTVCQVFHFSKNKPRKVVTLIDI